MQKPHRFVIDRVSSYAEEGAAFLRRRRVRARSFARVWRAGGTIDAYEPADSAGREIFRAAADLLAQRPRP